MVLLLGHQPWRWRNSKPCFRAFQTKYNGKIEYIQTTSATKFDDLATAVMSGDAPDFFSACDLDVFPRGAIQQMFAPFDDYIDLD